MRRNIDQRRTTFRDKSRRELRAGAICHIKCSAVCVQNACGTFDNEPMKFLRSNGFPESSAGTCQKIETSVFPDWNLFVRPLGRANPRFLEIGGKNPPANRRDKQS